MKYTDRSPTVVCYNKLQKKIKIKQINFFARHKDLKVEKLIQKRLEILTTRDF